MTSKHKLGRRDFLRAAGVGSLALTLPLFAPTRRSWADQPYEGDFWIHLNATGGWDPRLFFDPTLVPEQNRVYSSIETWGNFSYAPIPLDYPALELNLHPEKDQYLLTNADFLNLYGDRMTVINGIDTSTINHTLGRRMLGSGHTVIGYPSFGTVLAAALAPERVMAYFSGGGYDTTGGVLPLIRVLMADRLLDLVNPNEMVPGDSAQGHYHPQHTVDRIRQFQAERLTAMRDRTQLPQVKRAMQELLSARERDDDLGNLQLPPLTQLADPQLLDLERFMQRAQLAVSAFVSGLAVSANLEVGLFDSHVNNDIMQRIQLAKLWGGIHYLMQTAADAGIGDRLFVVVTSDFGRGPDYNNPSAKAGKDHWSVTSMIAMGPGVPGNRLIGATTDEQLPRLVDPDTLEVVPSDGVTITPASIHYALRKRAGIESSPIAQRFPIVGYRDLPLFG